MCQKVVIKKFFIWYLLMWSLSETSTNIMYVLSIGESSPDYEEGGNPNTKPKVVVEGQEKEGYDSYAWVYQTVQRSQQSVWRLRANTRTAIVGHELHVCHECSQPLYASLGRQSHEYEYEYERNEHEYERNAHIYDRIAIYGNSIDAYERSTYVRPLTANQRFDAGRR